MSKLLGTKCPECDHEFLFKTTAKRPRPTCPKCHYQYYIPIPPAQNTQKKESELSNKFETLDEATIEKLILDLLNEEPTESRIKLAVDFHNKVKGTDTINMEEPLDMTGFLQYEQSERKKESSPTVHETT